MEYSALCSRLRELEFELESLDLVADEQGVEMNVELAVE